MKNCFLYLGAILLMPVLLMAESKAIVKQNSLGASIGSIWAITYQMPYRDRNTLALSAGVGGRRFMAVGDILWYQPKFKQFKALNPYLGTGIGIATDQKSLGSDLGILIRAPLGATYSLKGRGVDIFSHIAPQLDTNGSSHLIFQIGMHYFY